jgi:hypothetical protein
MKSQIPTCLVLGCNNKPWYGYPHTFDMCCDMHKQINMVTFPTRTCMIPGCEATGVVGTSMKRVCKKHAMFDRDNAPMKLMVHCFKCGEIQVCNPYTPGFLVDNRYCEACSVLPGNPINHQLGTILSLEGVNFTLHGGTEFHIKSPSGIRVVVKLDNNFEPEIHRKDMIRACRKARNARQATIYILYANRYTGGEIAGFAHKRHDVLLEFLDRCLNMPLPDPFNMFRVVRLFYDGYIGSDIPFKSMM